MAATKSLTTDRPSALPLGAERLSGVIGARVDAQALSDAGPAGVEALRGLVGDFGVVFVRGFGVDEDAFSDLGQTFGEKSVHPLHVFQGRDSTVTVIEDTAKRPPAGFPWHTDLSWLQNPPRFGFLQALEIPASGGDTLWSGMSAAYNMLSDSFAAYVGNLSTVHTIDQTLLQTVVNNHGDETAQEFKDAYPPVTHPLVRAHPDSGIPCLYLCPMYMSHIDGVTEGESAALLDYLHGFIEDPNLAVRWHWSEGDVAIWDEATTVHRALPDHAPQHRRMRRFTIDGPVPVGIG